MEKFIKSDHKSNCNCEVYETDLFHLYLLLPSSNVRIRAAKIQTIEWQQSMIFLYQFAAFFTARISWCKSAFTEPEN